METTKHAKQRVASRHALTKPISIRLTIEEVTELKHRAGKQSLSEYVRRMLFDNSVDIENSDAIEPRLTPQMRQKLLAQILMRLGKLDTVHNVNQSLSAFNSGLIETSPEIITALEAVHSELTALRSDLLKALGLRP